MCTMYYWQVIKGEMLDVHFILDDPAGNSYLQVSVRETHSV